MSAMPPFSKAADYREAETLLAAMCDHCGDVDIFFLDPKRACFAKGSLPIDVAEQMAQRILAQVAEFRARKEHGSVGHA